MGSVFRDLSPETKIIGVELTGASSLTVSLRNNKNTELENVENFVDGASVRLMGDGNFEYWKNGLDEFLTIDEGLICLTILKVYNENALVVEPAGALSIIALELLEEKIKGKNIVCLVSGGNNDITRMEEIKERALLYEGLKHYFLVKFPQRPGALKEFVVSVLGDTDDIVHVQYTKKNQRSMTTALVGIVLKSKSDFKPLISRMEAFGFLGEYLNDNEQLFECIT